MWLMSLTVTSDSFAHGQRIPTKFTGDGQNISPGLRWTGVPQQAAELALIVDDPDAPMADPFVHWVLYKIPASATTLPEGAGNDAKSKAPAGVMQGRNSIKKPGYLGPAPPRGHGTHHYHFRLYALDKPLDVHAGLDKTALLAAMSGHVLDEGELVGTYDRA